MKYFVNSMSDDLVNGFVLVRDVVANDGPDYIMHLLS